MVRDSKEKMKSLLPITVFATILSALTLILLYCSDVKMKRDEEFWIFSRIGGRLVHGQSNGTVVANPPKTNDVHQDEYEISNTPPSTGLASIYNRFAAILTILESPWSKNESEIAASPVKVPDCISFSSTHTLSIANAPNKLDVKDGDDKRTPERGGSVQNDADDRRTPERGGSVQNGADDHKPSRIVFVDDRTPTPTVRPMFSFLFSNPENKMSVTPSKNENFLSRAAENPKPQMDPFSSKIKPSVIFPQKLEFRPKNEPKPLPRPIFSSESEESSLPSFVKFEPLFDFPTSLDDMFGPEIDPFASSEYDGSKLEREDFESTQSDDDSSATDLWHYFFRPRQFRRAD